MTTKLSLNSVLKLLNDLKLEPILQKENDQIYILLKIAKHEIPVFFGIRSNDTLLQLIAYFPYELSEKTMAQVARLLHFLNREIDMPGFGMDETQGLMFYRLVIPCINSQLSEKHVELYLATARVACESFIDAIALIAGGNMTFDQVLKQAGVQGKQNSQ